MLFHWSVEVLIYSNNGIVRDTIITYSSGKLMVIGSLEQLIITFVWPESLFHKIYLEIYTHTLAKCCCVLFLILLF